jgi:hypothetical protein
VLHPVGRLPARVYWRRRLVVLVVLLTVLAGAGWVALRLIDATAVTTSASSATTTSAPVPTPALEQVLPSLTAVRTPDTAPGTPAQETRRTPAARSAGPPPGSRCTDKMIDLGLRAPETVAAGSKPRLEIVVRNVSEVPCVRRLDKELQEIVLVDADGDRVWGSNDCFPEKSDRRATLAPGQRVALPIVWGGLSSRPKCAGERSTPKEGVYALRGRLDTKTTENRRIRLT